MMGNVSASIKDLAIQNNVLFRVIDRTTGKVVREVQGHNDATNTMLLGIAHYLQGDGVLNQASYTLSNYIPRYISLGTLGLANQDADANGYPAGLPDDPDEYVKQYPGYGSDGYNVSYTNNRGVFGLGNKCIPNTSPEQSYQPGELVSSNFKRFPISYREIIPESRAELAETVDIVYSAMISTGALKHFRAYGNDYIFITEAGLWSSDVVTEMSTSGGSKNNHLLAGYRLVPTNMDEYESADTETKKQMLKKCILKVEKNQVVQVIWKIQLGSRKQFESNDSSGGQE